MATPQNPGRQAARRHDVRAWLDTIGVADAAAAHQVQRAIDASFIDGIPVGEACEIEADDLMPVERDSLFGSMWLDTRPMERSA